MYKDPEKKKAYQREYNKRHRLTNSLSYQAKLARTRAWRDALRDEVFRAYGGWECACCGETEPAFLTLDHVDGAGSAHRRALRTKDRGGNTYGVFVDLKRRGFPPGFQVLCFNCNCAKHLLGACPHGPEVLGLGSTENVPKFF